VNLALAIAMTMIPRQIVRCSGCGEYYARLGRRRAVVTLRNYCVPCVDNRIRERDATRAYAARKKAAS
jgi:formylmethanofuran dehydrogenase subunit E